MTFEEWKSGVKKKRETQTQSYDEWKSQVTSKNAEPINADSPILKGLNIALNATKSIEGAKQQAPFSTPIKTGLKLATDTIKQQQSMDNLLGTYPVSKQGNYRLPIKSVSMDSMEKKKPTILDIPVMAAKAALEVPGDLKNLSIYGVRALGEAITGQPVESYRPEGYSFVKDILPEAAGNALDKFEKNQPLAGGFTKFMLENTVGDPTSVIGGGTLGELSKAGVIGKNSIEGTIGNLKTIGNLNKKAFANADKEITAAQASKSLKQSNDTARFIDNMQNSTKAQVMYVDQYGNVANDINKTPKLLPAPAKNAKQYVTINNVERPFVDVRGKTNNNSLITPNTSIIKQKVLPNKISIPVKESPKIDTIDMIGTGKPQKVNNPKTVAQNAYNKLVNNMSGLDKVSKNAGIQVDMARNAGGTTHYIINDGLVDMEGKKIGNSLKNIIDVPKSEKTAFDDYMYNRHNIARMKQGKPVFGHDVTADISTSKVVQYEKTYPQFKQKAEQFDKWWKDFSKEWGVKSGLTSEDLMNFLGDRYQHYVPTWRETTTESLERVKSNRLSPAKIVNEAIGGDKKLMPLNQSIPALVDKTVKAARKNEVYQALLNDIKNAPEKFRGVANIESLNPEEATILKNSIEGNGIEGILNLSDNALQADPIKGYSLTVMEGGKPVKINITDKRLFDSLKELNNYDNSDLNKFIRGLRNSTGWYKGLITGYNPFFALKNLSRDLPTAYIQGTQNNPFKFVKNLGKAAKDVVTNAPSFQEYKALGGERSNYFNVEKGISTSKLGKIGGKVGNVISGFNNITEAMPRYGEYLSTIQRGGTKAEAIHNAAEVTTNFARHGNYTKTIDALMPYLNAQVQGADKFIRSMSKPTNIAKAIGIVTTPAAGFYVLNQVVDKGGYDQLDNRTKDNYFLIPLGAGKFIKIAKTREAGVLFGSLFERIARTAQGEKESFKGFYNTVSTTFLPNNPITNNIFSPFTYNLPTNKDFAGRTITPQDMQNMSPYLRYDEKTSGIAKTIGKIFNLSPKEVDYVIKSYGGVVANILQPLTTNNGDVVKNVVTSPFTADSTYNNEVLNKFYENLNSLNTQKADAKQLGKDNNNNMLSGFNKISNDISTLRALMKQVENDKSISDKQKQETLKSYQQRILDLGNRANKMYNSNNTSYKSKYPELESDYPEPSFTYKKQTITLNPSQYLEYKKIIDDNIKASLKTNSISSYLNEEDRQKAIESIISKAQDNAKKNMLLKLKIN